jgi:hypothetical protein
MAGRQVVHCSFYFRDAGDAPETRDADHIGSHLDTNKIIAPGRFLAYIVGSVGVV